MSHGGTVWCIELNRPTAMSSLRSELSGSRTGPNGNLLFSLLQYAGRLRGDAHAEMQAQVAELMFDFRERCFAKIADFQ